MSNPPIPSSFSCIFHQNEIATLIPSAGMQAKCMQTCQLATHLLYVDQKDVDSDLHFDCTLLALGVWRSGSNKEGSNTASLRTHSHCHSYGDLQCYCPRCLTRREYIH